MSYRKLKPGDAGYKLMKHAMNHGMWVCDSYDHNEPEGCSNPECFKNEQWRDKEWSVPQQKSPAGDVTKQ